jgi:hypothetical protein
MFANLEANAHKTWSELFSQEISNPRFSSLLVILLIIGPISTALSVKKLLQSDNNIYFFEKKVIYKDHEYHDIQAIKNGCCPIKGKRSLWILILILGGWVVVPLKIWEILWSYILKLAGHNDLRSLEHNFIIIDNQFQKPLAGAVFSKQELKQLLVYQRTYNV